STNRRTGTAVARVERSETRGLRCLCVGQPRISLTLNPGYRSFTLLPAPSQLRPIFQTLPDLAFEAAFGRVVEALAAERLGEIVLPGKCVGRFVIVFVARAVTLALHQLRRRVEDVLGRQQRARLLGG